MGIASCSVAPISLAYCDKCVRHRVEPFDILVAAAAAPFINDKKPTKEDFSEDFQDTLGRSLDYLDKSETEFWEKVEMVRSDMRGMQYG